MEFAIPRQVVLTLFKIWIVIDHFWVYVDSSTHLKSNIKHETLTS